MSRSAPYSTYCTVASLRELRSVIHLHRPTRKLSIDIQRIQQALRRYQGVTTKAGVAVNAECEFDGASAAHSFEGSIALLASICCAQEA